MKKHTIANFPKLFSAFFNVSLIDNFLVFFDDVAPQSASDFFDILSQITPQHCDEKYKSLNLLNKIQALSLEDVPSKFKPYFLHNHLEQIFHFHYFTTSLEFSKKQKALSPIFSSLSSTLKFNNFSQSYQLFKKNVPQNCLPIFASLLLQARILLDINSFKSFAYSPLNSNSYSIDKEINSNVPDLDKIFQYIDEQFLSNKQYINQNFSQLMVKEQRDFLISNNFFICKKISSDFLPVSPFFHLEILSNCEYANSAKIFSMLIEQGAQVHHQDFFQLQAQSQQDHLRYCLPENFIIKTSKNIHLSIYHQALSWKIINSYLEKNENHLTENVFFKQSKISNVSKLSQNTNSPTPQTILPSTENAPSEPQQQNLASHASYKIVHDSAPAKKFETPVNNNYTQSPLFSIFTYHPATSNSILSSLHPNLIRQFLHSYANTLCDNELFIDSLIFFAKNKDEYISKNTHPHKQKYIDGLFSLVEQIIIENSLRTQANELTTKNTSKLKPL